MSKCGENISDTIAAFLFFVDNEPLTIRLFHNGGRKLFLLKSRSLFRVVFSPASYLSRFFLSLVLLSSTDNTLAMVCAVASVTVSSCSTNSSLGRRFSFCISSAFVPDSLVTKISHMSIGSLRSYYSDGNHKKLHF